MSNVTQTGAVGEVVVTQTGQEAAVTVVTARGPAGSAATVDQTIIDGSVNAVAGNAVFDALALKAPIASPTFTGTVTAPHIHGSIAGNLYVHVRNTSGGTLTKGTPLYITGNVGTAGNEDRVTVAAADNTNPAKMPAVALLGSDLANNGDGNGIIVGELTNLNIPSYSINQELYVGAGAIATTKPTTGEVQSVGVVARINTNTGIIVVNMQGRRDAAITTSTSSNLTGFIAANGTNVSGATEGSDFANPNTIVLRDSNGTSRFTVVEASGGVYSTDSTASIETRFTFRLYNGNYTTTLSHAATADRAIAFPDKAGTVAMIDAETHTGAHAFSSTTRPTSAGTGTPEATSLITAADRRTEEVADLSNVYYRQIMGHELGVWATVGISPSSVIDGNARAGCRFIGTTGLSSASAQGGGIKYPDGGITGGSTFSLQASFDFRFLFRNSLTSTIFDIAHFVSLRNNTNFWSASSIGLYHVAQPAATWAATTAYTVGNRINVSGIVYVCSTSGTSGLTQPTFNATINGTTNDNTVVWRTLGPHTSDKWALAFVDASSNITLTDTGVAWVAGTSNTTALRLRSNGSSVFASVNGSAEVSVARGALFAATPYIMCRGESATASRIAGLIWTVESASI
jgi:hypothetical protein